MNIVASLLMAIGALMVGAVGSLVLLGLIVTAMVVFRDWRRMRRARRIESRIASRFRSDTAKPDIDAWTTRN